MVPVLYFGLQFAAAPFYRGYSFMARDASTLGGPGSSWPGLFNVGCLCIGLATLIGAWGFRRAFDALTVRPVIAWITALAVVSCGLGSINAGLFPLPDPRHTEGWLAICGLGIFLLPFVLPIALWKLLEPGMKSYFIGNIIALVPLVLVMSGLVQRFSMMAGIQMPRFQTFLNGYQGLLQRIAAVIVFVPIGVSAWYLMRRMRVGTSVSGD
jgi:hypothetical protein